MKKNAPYFSFLESEFKPDGNTFYPNFNFPWIKKLEENHSIISKEILSMIENNKKVQPYFAAKMVNIPGNWKTLGFMFWGLVDKSQCRKCPNTIKILSDIPGLISVSISIMEPESEIFPHHGDTDAIYRCHYGISVPASLPVAGFKVGNDEMSWGNGKVFVFNDSEKHSAWNQSKERRIILILDIIKPEYASEKKWICSNILSFLSLMMMGFKPIQSKNKKYSTLILSSVLANFILLYQVIFRTKINS